MNDELDLPEAIVREKPRLSRIWFLPLLAVVIGIGMVIKSWQSRGIDVRVTFQTAEGLEANKTKVKYRNVDIGKVKAIGFSPDHEHIVVRIEIEKQMEELLKSDSQLWVVRPRVGAQGVSGIGTLLSGAYVEIAPGSEGDYSVDFVGLESPPVSPLNAEGVRLNLVSRGGKPISVGSTVVYRGFTVGQIESFVFEPQTREATYGVFISPPYDALVTTNTVFWNAGGVSLSTGADGIKFDMASLGTLIEGGVEFDIPDDRELGERIQDNVTFKLFQSYDDIVESREYEFVEYAILVEDSIGGLSRGAPVEYRGIRVGTVSQPYLNLDADLDRNLDDSGQHRIPVIVRLEPGRVPSQENVDKLAFINQINRGITQGLTATIETANILTGSLKVSLNFGGESTGEIQRYQNYPVIPTKRGGLARITDKLEAVLSKLESLPLNATVNNTNDAIKTADSAMISLSDTLKELQNTLAGLQPESELYRSLDQSMRELKTTLMEARPLIKEISNKPNSLIFGGEQAADLQPGAKEKIDE